MGNNKAKPSGSPIKSVDPTTRSSNSKLINNMMMRTFRRIEEDKYLSTPETFVPKIIFLEEDKPNDDKAQFESTQPMFGAIGESKESTQVMDILLNSKNSTMKDNRLSKRSNDSKTSSISNAKGINRFQEPKSKDKFFPSQNKKNGKEPMKPVSGPVKKTSLKPERGLMVKPEGKSSKLRSVLSPSNVADQEDDGANIGLNLEKVNRKKFVIDCAIDKKIFSLPDDVQFLLISFLLDDYQSLTMVSSLFYYKINDLLDNFLVSLDNSFLKAHMSLLSFKRSYFSVTPYEYHGTKRIRMDRNIIAEVLENLKGKTITLSYSYELLNKKGTQYKAVYKFDVLAKGPRTIWIYKEDLNQTVEEKLALIQPIIPVCCNDNIKFAVNFYNLFGPIDLSTLEWKQPIIENIPQIPTVLYANNLDGLDRNRICEAEELHDEWFLFKYFDKKTKFEYDFFQPWLTLKETKCAGVDITSIKSKYEVTHEGKITRAMQKLGVNIEVFPEFEEIVAEVKRNGFFYDVDNFLQLRVGDKLIFYMSRADP